MLALGSVISYIVVEDEHALITVVRLSICRDDTWSRSWSKGAVSKEEIDAAK